MEMIQIPVVQFARHSSPAASLLPTVHSFDVFVKECKDEILDLMGEELIASMIGCLNLVVIGLCPESCFDKTGVEIIADDARYMSVLFAMHDEHR